MKKWKRILSLMLVLVMILQGSNMEALAAETAGGEDLTSNQAQQLDPNSAEYREWKENYVSGQQQQQEQQEETTAKSTTGSAIDINENQEAPSTRTLLRAATVNDNRLLNDYVEVAVNGGGRFTIGTTGGNPDNLLDDNKKMLYGHPWSTTSYTTIRVDGANQIFSSNTTTIFDTDKNSCTKSYSIGDITISQILTLKNNTSTNREDTVEIKYIVTNAGQEYHTTGVRIMLDTMLGDNDAAPFCIPGIRAVTSELELSGDSIPEYWQAFDSLTNPSVISQGTLYTNNICRRLEGL